MRNYEPKLALVPPPPLGLSGTTVSEMADVAGDAFYKHLDRLARKGKAKIMVVEVAGTEQAVRVVKGIDEEGDGHWDGCQLWHDDWDGRYWDEAVSDGKDRVGELGVRHLGTGHGRAVVCWRGQGREWLHGGGAALA